MTREEFIEMAARHQIAGRDTAASLWDQHRTFLSKIGAEDFEQTLLEAFLAVARGRRIAP